VPSAECAMDGIAFDDPKLLFKVD